MTAVKAAVFLLWGVACFVFFSFCYKHHLFYQEQNQLFLMTEEYVCSYYQGCGWLSRLMGDFLTQFYYYVYAGPAILTIALLAEGDIAGRIPQQWGWQKLSFVIGIAVMTIEACFCLRYSYRLSDVLSHLGLFTSLLLGSMFLRKKHKGIRIISLLTAGVIGYWLFGFSIPKHMPRLETDVEKELAVTNEYYFGNHSQIIKMVESEKEPTKRMMFYYNLVQAKRGTLPDNLLRFKHNELGTFTHVGPATPLLTINDMNELYWLLGDMTYTERAAMMMNVFSKENRNVRAVKRLAECNIVSGDKEASEKYIRILEKTLLWKEWAKKLRKDGATRFQDKIAFANKRDTLSLSDNSHFIMMQLLDSNPSNTVALDYILCSDLLLKDIENFKRDYDRYCIGTDSQLSGQTADFRHGRKSDKTMSNCLPSAAAGNTVVRPRIKELYQQALCIWLAGTQATEEEWQKYIYLPQVLKQFSLYNQHRGSKEFANTYWYYFDIAEKPQVDQ